MRNTLRTPPAGRERSERTRLSPVRPGEAAASASAVAKGATVAPLLRRPFPPFDFGPRRPPQSRRLRAPTHVPIESRIVLRTSGITLR